LRKKRTPLGEGKYPASHHQSRHKSRDSKRMRPKTKFGAVIRSFADVWRRLFALHPAVVGIGHAVIQLVFALRAPDCGGAFARIAALDYIHAYGAASGRSSGHRALGLAAGQGTDNRHENEDSEIHEVLWGRKCRGRKQPNGLILKPGARAFNCGYNFPIV
jgi:hypothetical protein